jgi:ferredoxin
MLASCPGREDEHMKVAVDRSRCTGHGRCYLLAPELFEPDDEGRALVVVAEPTAEQERRALLAEANCPERAITLE